MWGIALVNLTSLSTLQTLQRCLPFAFQQLLVLESRVGLKLQALLHTPLNRQHDGTDMKIQPSGILEALIFLCHEIIFFIFHWAHFLFGYIYFSKITAT